MLRTSRHLLLLLTVTAGGQLFISSSASGQNAQRAAEREIARREAALPEGNAALARGKLAMEAKDYVHAHEEFRTAVAFLPDAVVSGKAHDDAVAGFCDSGIKIAEQCRACKTTIG